MTDQGQWLKYADRVGRVWVNRYRVSPTTGRMVGYLLVCDPAAQTINELSEALQASRSAVTASVKDLENIGLLRRRRGAGERVDRVRIVFEDSRGFDPGPYWEMASFSREGLRLVADQNQESRAQLEQMASFSEFLAERLPELLQEWREDLKAQLTRSDSSTVLVNTDA